MSHRPLALLLRPSLAVLVSLACVALTTSLAAAASPGPSAVVSPAASPVADAFDPNAARSECEEKGGQVQQRRAAWDTNADVASWLQLAGDVELCRFQTLGSGDDSRIYVDLRTLTSHGPTLASVAYLSKVPMASDKSAKKDKSHTPVVAGMANPATGYCTSLGGSSVFGTTGVGGGWVDLADPIDPVVAMCVFPDGSMIDEWGIAYYSGGVVRGADLALLFDYQPGRTLPPMFPQ